MSDVKLDLPARYSTARMVDGNAARQLVDTSKTAALESREGEWFARHGSERISIQPRGATPHGEAGLEILREAWKVLPSLADGAGFRWTGSPPTSSPASVLEALKDRFTLRTADPSRMTPGLRVPQSGAVHAILAHWSTSPDEPATIVLPTGTGKTETMLAVAVSERLRRVLVLVPSDRLRVQIAEAFETFGVLPDIGVLARPLPGLVVGRIEHGFSSAASARSFGDRCNVLVTTPNALSASSAAAQRAIVSGCSHLFIDEAHHVAADSWARIRELFDGKPILQFTATPYRFDGKKLGGRVIYDFPLGMAQDLGYFQPITYESVLALADPDSAVAERAVSRLREDIAQGYDHLIMARVGRIGRARDEVLPIYQRLAGDLNPVVLHSDLTRAERSTAEAAIRDRTSRIVVCVDMLGEGYDLPELKIAALHDPFKSLGVTLQFIGRFARSRNDLGTATAVVARPDAGYDVRLRALYAEDSQWNRVIRTIAEQAIEEVKAHDAFDRGFSVAEAEDPLSIHVLRPRMSTVVYETHCSEWEPERIGELFAAETIVSPLSINREQRVAWLAVEVKSPVRWANYHSLEDTSFHLHIAFWDAEQSLLYINTSQLESLHEELAAKACGDDVERVHGEVVYRALGDIKRPTPINVGVIDLRNRSRRFSLHVGADVYEGFPVAEQQSKTNTNISVVAYDDGDRVTIAAARKGRIWSQQAADSVLEWTQWCRTLGPKLKNDSISLDALFRNFVRPRPLEARPELVALAIDWPWVAYVDIGESFQVKIGGAKGLLIDCELAIIEHDTKGPIAFEVRLEDEAVRYEATVKDGNVKFTASADEAYVVRPRRPAEPLSAYLDREGAMIWFENEVSIEGFVRYEFERDQPPIGLDQIASISWNGIDIQRESQGKDRDPTTIQARAADHLLSLRDWDVVVDDDAAGEIADLVAVKETSDALIVHLVHCKFSSEKDPGARVEDLYAVCGQAHRSAHHRQHPDAMIRNLIRRERRRQQRGEPGLMVGDEAALLNLQDAVRRRRATFHITVVQPGFSKAGAKARHLQLLGAVDVYVSEIAAGKFDVWCSA